VEVECFDKTLTIQECVSEMKNARARFKDILLRDPKSNSTLCELEVAAARVEGKHPLITADNEELSQEREDLIKKEVKALRESVLRPANIQEMGTPNNRAQQAKLCKEIQYHKGRGRPAERCMKKNCLGRMKLKNTSYQEMWSNFFMHDPLPVGTRPSTRSSVALVTHIWPMISIIGQ
jgi:hypothetical protein